MKAILVIDEMPTGCIGCPCYYEDRGRCQNTWESVEDDFARPSWCPLIPLPEKQKHPVSGALFLSPQEEIDYNYGFIDGYNALLMELVRNRKDSNE